VGGRGGGKGGKRKDLRQESDLSFGGVTPTSSSVERGWVTEINRKKKNGGERKRAKKTVTGPSLLCPSAGGEEKTEMQVDDHHKNCFKVEPN